MHREAGRERQTAATATAFPRHCFPSGDFPPPPHQSCLMFPSVVEKKTGRGKEREREIDSIPDDLRRCTLSLSFFLSPVF